MVARICVTSISSKDFYHEYLVKNKPCILTENVTHNWNCRELWVTVDGKPNFAYLKSQFGTSKAPVANCKVKHYNAQLTEKITVTDFTEYWQKYIDSGYSDSMDCLYLKDWHLQKEYPCYCAYTLPEFFKLDWLNEYCKQKTKDDYDFVYMGPKGSWTPFHADVFRSHSWSANICGKKKWLLCPPGAEQKLIDALGNLPYNLTEVKTEVPELIEVIQGPGEVIFVPSNWHHQVLNLEDTISINRNWFNGSNIDDIFTFLLKSLEEVQQEISDCKEMEGWDKQCQIILKASQGMDFYDFHDLLYFVAHTRPHCELYSFELRKLRDVLIRFQQTKDLSPDLLSLSDDTLSSDLFSSLDNGKNES